MNRFILKLSLIILFLAAYRSGSAQVHTATSPGNGNPLIPGYFADPTIRKFGDTFYIYATTDGNGGGHGPAQVWTSKDFVNWTMQDMNWPTSPYYWAPDVIQANDNKYYMYYCQPVDIYGASSASPTGPWTPLLPDGKSMIPNYFVPGVITLDAQTFKDDDGKVYMFWGTWGIYPDHGCGVGLLNADMHTFAKTAKIPNTIAKEFFEAPFMFKRNGIYYLTYSSGYCENETYRVQYAMSKTGPFGPYEFGKNNPVLSTSADGSVHGPGHQSVAQVGDDFYMVYHRHNNPHSNGGYHRQVCADKIEFDADGSIKKLVPTHTGVSALGQPAPVVNDLAYLKKVTASSFYNENYIPAFAADNNNGTLWRPAKNDNAPAWLQIDLGKVMPVKQIETQFEYATWYYQYQLQTSTDGKTWTVFADRSKNTQHGSPMIDKGSATARYVRLTISNTEYPGLFKAVWNIKVLGKQTDAVQQPNLLAGKPMPANLGAQGLLASFSASELQPGAQIAKLKNTGALTGDWIARGTSPIVSVLKGRKAILFNGRQSLESSFAVSRTLTGNSSYTVCYSVYCPELKDENPVLSWTSGGGDHISATFGYGSNTTWGVAQHGGVSDFPFAKVPAAGQWHDIAVTYDGAFEKVYVDGKLDNTENKMLFLRPARQFIVGGRNDRSNYFKGAIAGLKVFSGVCSEVYIKGFSESGNKSDLAVYLDATDLNYGDLTSWENNGAAGGAFKIKEGNQPKITDVAGKIAADFSGGKSLTLNELASVPPKQSTIAMSLLLPSAGNSWHYVVKVNKGNTSTLYIDGKAIALKDALYQPVSKIIKGIEQSGSLQNIDGAVSKLAVYTKSLSVAQVSELNTLWQSNLHPPIQGAIAFKNAPAAISPNMVEMTAAGSAATNLRYLFTNKNASAKNEWIDEPYYLATGLQPDKQYGFTFKVKDNYGNVSGEAPIALVSTATAGFDISTDDFSAAADKLTGWLGITGLKDTATAVNITSGDKKLTLSSKGTNWDGNKPYGPFIYKEVSGDFVAQVKVSDITGRDVQKVKGNNETGLMVRLVPAGGEETFIQNGIFPAWKCGNLVTDMHNGQRRQFNIQSGWAYYPYLQIQKTGDKFYLRASNDGLSWTELPGSPFTRPDMANAKLQIGLYQCSYGPQEGYGTFADFNLSIKK